MKLNVVDVEINEFNDIFDQEHPSICHTVVEKWWAIHGVKKIIINEQGVKGALFIPPGKPPFPGKSQF